MDGWGIDMRRGEHLSGVEERRGEERRISRSVERTKKYYIILNE